MESCLLELVLSEKIQLNCCSKLFSLVTAIITYTLLRGLSPNVFSVTKKNFRLRLCQTREKNPATYRKHIWLGFFSPSSNSMAITTSAGLPCLARNYFFSRRNPFGDSPLRTFKVLMVATVRPSRMILRYMLQSKSSVWQIWNSSVRIKRRVTMVKRCLISGEEF